METTEVSFSSKKKKKRKSELVEEPVPFDMNTPVKKKKKKKRAEEVSPPFFHANEQVVLKKKKKRKQQDDEEEGHVAVETIETKKIKIKNGTNEKSVSKSTVDSIEEMSVVSMDTNYTKKEKKKQKNEKHVAMDTSEKDHENRLGDESVVIAMVSPPGESSGVTMETNHKKKKKKKQRDGEECVAIETSEINMKNGVSDERDVTISDSEEASGVTMETNHTKKKKKKKQRDGEEYVAVETNAENVEYRVSVEKVAMTVSNSEASGVAGENNHTRKKKKKKNKQQDGEEYVAIETNAENRVSVERVAMTVSNSEASGVAGENNHTRKKKKKKNKQQDGEEYVAIETNAENRVSVERVAMTVSNSEASGVAGENNHTRKKKKKKNKQQDGEEYVAIETNAENRVSVERVAMTVSNSEASGVAGENNHTKKKKKKKKNKQQDGEDEELVAIETSVKNHENKAKSVAIATTDQTNKNKHVTVCDETSVTSGRGARNKSTMTSQQKDGAELNIKKEKTEMTIPLSRATTAGINSALLDELEEFIPKIRKQSVSRMSKYLRYDLHRFRKFKEQGVVLRWGPYSEQENQHIRSNIDDFMALTGIPSVAELMFPDRFKHKTLEIKRLKAQHRFLEKIAEGIPRTCEAVYIRAKKMFDDRNHLGRFTEEELRTLKRLHCLHGNDWKTISEKTGRSVHSLQKRFATLDSDSGPWKEEEVLRLKEALKSHLETLARQTPSGPVLTRDQLCNNLPWKKVAEKVKDRSWIQCRLKWFSLLKTKLCSGGGVFKCRKKGYRAKIDLINALYTKYQDGEDGACIDWDEVTNVVSNVTPVCVQKTFHRLKTSKVPNWKFLSNKEIIDFLYHKVVPHLEQMADGSHQEGEDRYYLSDIFSVCEGEVDGSRQPSNQDTDA